MNSSTGDKIVLVEESGTEDGFRSTSTRYREMEQLGPANLNGAAFIELEGYFRSTALISHIMLFKAIMPAPW